MRCPNCGIDGPVTHACTMSLTRNPFDAAHSCDWRSRAKQAEYNCDSLRLEVQAWKHKAEGDNAYLIRERDEARAKLAEASRWKEALASHMKRCAAESNESGQNERAIELMGVTVERDRLSKQLAEAEAACAAIMHVVTLAHYALTKAECSIFGCAESLWLLSDLRIRLPDAGRALLAELAKLRAVAEAARASMVRREMYEAITRHPDETIEDYHERRDVTWKEIRSADALLRAALDALEKGGGE